MGGYVTYDFCGRCGISRDSLRYWPGPCDKRGRRHVYTWGDDITDAELEDFVERKGS